MTEVIDFEEGRPRRDDVAELGLIVDVDGFEGPLDLLLELARRQKVDLARISILALAEQYLVFIEELRKLRLELAADYLVMAAWLAYLKSRLLLPDPPKGEEPSRQRPRHTALQLRLQRLETIRNAGKDAGGPPASGGATSMRAVRPEPVRIRHKPLWDASLYDLLSAYARERQKQMSSRVTMKRRTVWTLAEATRGAGASASAMISAATGSPSTAISRATSPRPNSVRRSSPQPCRQHWKWFARARWPCDRNRLSGRSG